MNRFAEKCAVIFVVGMAVFLKAGTEAGAMDDAYRNPMLSGTTQTWVYQEEEYESSRSRVLADDQEERADGDNGECH